MIGVRKYNIKSETPQNPGDKKMATATKTPSKRAASSAKATEAEDTQTATRVRKQPTTLFEIVDELPANPPRKPREGGAGFVSEWPNLLQEVVDGAPKSKWVKRRVYETNSGARNAANNLEENGEVFPELDEPYQWLVDVRKVDLGEGKYGSALFVGMFHPEEDAAEFERITKEAAERAETKAKREATMKANGTAPGRKKAASSPVADEDDGE